MFAIPHLPTTTTNANSNSNSNRLNNSMNAAAQTGARSMRSSIDRSRSARNVVARLPILERGGSTRNFRELPDRRRNTAVLESPRNLNASRRRSNNTRRFFVADHSSRSSGASSATTTAASLSDRLRRITLERTDSASSMGSYQSSESMRSLRSTSNHLNNSNNNVVNNYHDSVTSILSMDSLSIPSRAPASSRLSFTSNLESSLNIDTDSEDMMSLFSKDSVRVRQNQLDSSSILASSFSRSSDHRGAPMDEDLISTASASECTVYSFDLRPPALGRVNATARGLH